MRDGRPVGWLGALHPSVEEALDLASRVLVFHLDLDAIGSGVVPRFETLSKFPSIRRDIAIVVAQDVPAQAVQACVREVAGELLQELTLFDIYAGKGIDRGRKSLALGLTLQEPSRTLKDEEVDRVVAGVVGCLRERLGATLRE